MFMSHYIIAIMVSVYCLTIINSLLTYPSINYSYRYFGYVHPTTFYCFCTEYRNASYGRIGIQVGLFSMQIYIPKMFAFENNNNNSTIN